MLLFSEKLLLSVGVFIRDYFGTNNYCVSNNFGPPLMLKSMATQKDIVKVNPEQDQTFSLSIASGQMDFYWVTR